MPLIRLASVATKTQFFKASSFNTTKTARSARDLDTGMVPSAILCFAIATYLGAIVRTFAARSISTS